MRDLAHVGVSPLPARDDGDAAFFVNVRQSRFGLEIGVFLVGGLVFALDDHVRFGEGGFHVPFANLVMDANIRIAAFGMQLRRAGLHGLDRVRDERQVFVLDLDQPHRFRRGRLGLRDDRRDLVALEADDVRCHPPSPHFLRSIPKGRRKWGEMEGGRSAQDGLVLPLQAVFVDRHILRGEDRHYARRGRRLVSFDSFDARVRTFRE